MGGKAQKLAYLHAALRTDKTRLAEKQQVNNSGQNAQAQQHNKEATATASASFPRPNIVTIRVRADDSVTHGYPFLF